MSNFDENVVTKLKRLEREIERLKVGEKAKAQDDGWIPVSATWTYTSATTITVPSGAAAIYKVGQGIRLTQTSVKYFYVIGVANTTLTITGGSDYTLTNAAISAISYTNTPGTAIGFPVWFNWTPSKSGWTETGTVSWTTRYCLVGKTVTISVKVYAMGGSIANPSSATITLPIAPSIGSSGINETGNITQLGTVLAYGNGNLYFSPFTAMSGEFFISLSYEVA